MVWFLSILFLKVLDIFDKESYRVKWTNIWSILWSLVYKCQPIIKHHRQKGSLARVFKNNAHQGIKINFPVVLILEVIKLRDQHFHVWVRLHTFKPIVKNLFILECSKQILEGMSQEVLLIFNFFDRPLLLKNLDSWVDIHDLQINVESFHYDLLIRGMNLRNLHQIHNIVILELQDVWNLINHALSIFMLDHFNAHFISH